MNKKILLVEDEPGLVVTLSDRLRNEGYQVETASDGKQALDRALAGGVDLIILDVMLPLKSGLDVCRDLRSQNVTTPILMLTARSQIVDKVLGLKTGADDYLTKPFDMLELLARVEALLRRPPVAVAPSESQYQFGDVKVDQKSTEVTRSGEHVQLSALEFQLLCYFVEHRGETLSRQRLLNE